MKYLIASLFLLSPVLAPLAASKSALPQPELEVTTIDGETYDLKDQRGHWVVVNYWATWCPPCLREMPELSAMDAEREDISVIGLAFEEIELEEMRAFMKEHPVVYPIALIDVYDPPKGFDVPRGLPTTYVIAPDGSLAQRIMGPVTRGDIERIVARKSKS
ncbi:MAG: TlpA family protein disulfide reductase [Lysobacterales bacterium]